MDQQNELELHPNNEAQLCPQKHTVTSEAFTRPPNKTNGRPEKITRKKEDRTKRQRRKRTKKRTPLNILYCNPNGICGKTESLASAAETAEAHIICLAETKLQGPPPSISGYRSL
jgi:hypothetical protein